MAELTPPASSSTSASVSTSMSPHDALLGSRDENRRDVERERIFASLNQRMFGASGRVSIGRFVLEGKLGSGAMGMVYAAHDPELDRKVALKVLHSHDPDDSVTQRLELEAKALAKLRHPNVVTVYEVGSDDEDRFIVMDLVQGCTLRTWLRDRPDWRRVLSLFIEAGRGLLAAHEAGLIHRDFKPDNVLVEDGHARVVDFGLARPDEAELIQTRPEALNLDSDERLTHSGAVVGTPAYMAPEQFLGGSAAAADQYAYCVTLYEALYGTRPFRTETLADLEDLISQRQRTIESPPTLVPQWVRQVVLRGLAFDPKDRWPSMAALVEQLERVHQRPWRRQVVFATGGGVLLGAIAMSMATGDARPCDDVSDPVREVWNPARRASLSAAFRRSDVAYAAETWIRVEPRLDDYTERWAEAREDVCAAVYHRHEQSDVMFDARMQCLDRHLDEFRAFTEILQEPDEATVSRATQAAFELDSLDDCDNERLLRHRLERAEDVPTAPPELYAQLAEIRVGKRAGRYADSMAQASELLETAFTTKDTELLARSLHVMSELQDLAEEVEDAERTAKLALEHAEEVGDDRLRARIQIRLVSIFAKTRQLERGHELVRLTRSTLHRLGDPPELAASLVAQEGNVLEAEGRYADSLERHREALRLLENLDDASLPGLAFTHRSISRQLQSLSRLDEALVEQRLAMELEGKVLGPNHPQVARSQGALAGVLSELGRLDEAAESARLALEVGTRSLGPEHVFVARAHGHLAVALAQTNDFAESEQHFRTSARLLEAALGSQSVDAANTWSNLGRLLALTGQADKAIPVLERARTSLTHALHDEHPDLIYVLNNLAAAQGKLERWEDARSTARHALAIATATYGDAHTVVAGACFRIGKASLELGEAGPAIEYLQRSVDIHERQRSRIAARAEPRVDLARAYLLRGDRKRARRELRQARSEFVEDPQDHVERLAGIDTLLADNDLE